MCTVSLIALDDAEGSGASVRCFRLACNRDESRTRPEARPPEVRSCGNFKTILPVDPISNGTWIAVNETGLTATLLNTYERPVTQMPPRDRAMFLSRGTILPAIMEYARATDAGSVISKLAARDYPPFLVVLTDGRDVIELRSDGQRIDRMVSRWDVRPLLFTSSGLGDDVVLGPRRELFNGFFADGVDLVAAQDSYHRHQWPDRPHLSVRMSRPDARTVSHTTVQVSRREVQLFYQPVPPNSTIPESKWSLPRRTSH